MPRFFPLVLFFFITCSALAQDWLQKVDQPIELGQVHWLRNYNEAISQAKEKDLPVFIFFQEVPGCSTCSTFGHQVMSHPLIVEAIESHFVPLIIYNNKDGADAAILKQYKEPSWNNPVIRIVDHMGKDIVPRHAGAYDPAQVVNTIQNALLADHKIIPNYLTLLSSELSNNNAEAVLSMYCYWTGEKVIGKLDGVTATQAGYMNGSEVVKVNYNPDKISYDELVSKASKSQCADEVYTDNTQERKLAWANKIPSKGMNSYKVSKDDKYYLAHTEYANIPMTAIQATKANAMLSNQQSPAEILSPRQLEVMDLVNRKKLKVKNRAKEDFLESWSEIMY